MHDDEKEYRIAELDKAMVAHEKRIGKLEEFQLMVRGALTVIGFMLGSGFITAIILFAVGIV